MSWIASIRETAQRVKNRDTPHPNVELECLLLLHYFFQTRTGGKTYDSLLITKRAVMEWTPPVAELTADSIITLHATAIPNEMLLVPERNATATAPNDGASLRFGTLAQMPSVIAEIRRLRHRSCCTVPLLLLSYLPALRLSRNPVSL
ncbi:hypothetical protein DBV15_08070 [Temnothorax longispinosus]|uniref:Uncharacterized protein n=1 Tax=Temnothorax longispinosus TaxID=300112 RepID=A0A4S2JN65_9HYME|nr:hypothetical protein DBV15_08070 [Temnothorax longispinosus]